MEKVFDKIRKLFVAMNITEDKRKFEMLLHFGGDYVRDFIGNAVPKVEGYDATVEYLNEHLNPENNDTFEIYKFQKTIQDSDKTIQQFCNRLRSIANRCNFENEQKHIKNAVILGTHSQKLRKFCFTNPTVSLEEVVNRGTLFEEAVEQAGVVEDHKSINNIKDLDKNDQSLQIQLKSLQEQLQKFIANIKIDNVKVKFLIDTGSSANILCYETVNKISKLNMNNYKLKKTSIKVSEFLL